jgi:hypothetical protein
MASSVGVVWGDPSSEVTREEAMHYLLGGLLAVLIVGFAIGAVTGRVRVRSGCAVADPRCDLRMRSASPPEPPSTARVEATGGRPIDPTR